MDWYTSTIRLISPTALLTTIDGEILHLPSLRRRPICGHHHHHHHHCVIIIIIIIIFIIIPPPTWGQFSKYLVASVFRLTLIKRFHRSTYIWRRSSFEHRYYFCYSLKGKQFFLHQWYMTSFIQNQSREWREFPFPGIPVRIRLIFSCSTLRNHFLFLVLVSIHEIDKKNIPVPVSKHEIDQIYSRSRLEKWDFLSNFSREKRHIISRNFEKLTSFLENINQ